MDFFRALNIRWLNVFINKIKDTKRGEFSLENSNETLKWSDYFRIFVDIKDNMLTEVSVKERSVWHAATHGYSMSKIDPAIAVDDDEDISAPSEKNSIADDFTEDDPSVVDDENLEDDVRDGLNQAKAGKPAANIDKRPKNWNPEFTSPIFFGYSAETVIEYEKKISSEKALLKARENRAIDRARATRSVAIDALEKTTTAQANARQDKIEKLTAKYEANVKKREVDFERNERELLPAAFAIFEVFSP